jgi:hypothetical protein
MKKLLVWAIWFGITAASLDMVFVNSRKLVLVNCLTVAMGLVFLEVIKRGWVER